MISDAVTLFAQFLPSLLSYCFLKIVLTNFRVGRVWSFGEGYHCDVVPSC